MASVNKRKWTYKGREREAWVVRYKDKTGAHRSRQFSQKKAADDYKRRVENELEAGLHVAPRQSLSVSAALDEFEEWTARRLSAGDVGPSWIEGIRQSAIKIRPRIGNVLLTELTWKMVDNMVADLRTARSACTGRTYCNSTVRRVVSHLSTVLDFAMRRGYVSRNAAKEAAPEIGPMPVAPIRTFRREEIVALFGAVDRRWNGMGERDRVRWRAMIYLAACCGLRRGEILALGLDVVDFENGSIRIVRSLDDRDKLKDPKTKAGHRVVPMPSIVAAALRDYLAVADIGERGLIFRNANGRSMLRSNFQRGWRCRLASAGLSPEAGAEWLHFHALRHFAGSAWLDGGVPLADVSRLLGHANVAVTARIYSHAIDAPMAKAPLIEQVTALLAPPITQELRKAA